MIYFYTVIASITAIPASSFGEGGRGWLKHLEKICDDVFYWDLHIDHGVKKRKPLCLVFMKHEHLQHSCKARKWWSVNWKTKCCSSHTAFHSMCTYVFPYCKVPQWPFVIQISQHLWDTILQGLRDVTSATLPPLTDPQLSSELTRGDCRRTKEGCWINRRLRNQKTGSQCLVLRLILVL